MRIEKEEVLFEKRIKELAQSAYNRGICTYTDFLNINEISLFYRYISYLPKISYQLYGGYEDAERRILCFYSDDSYLLPEFPIHCIRILPLNQKFSDVLSHRDFLGAVLNLGIERSKIGDILIKENEGYLFCNNKISSFIIDNLNKVKHTTIRCELANILEFEVKPTLKEITGTVSSLRIDSILSVALNTSRSSITSLIVGGKVFVNSRLTISNSYQLKENDIVSVRGYGKFIYQETVTQTKKGRFYIRLQKYI
ncbi:YlmH family RNA-binding protein [Anaeromicropila herbilytica]|uniref:RNA-binding protein S4 n=1 Tax=Anaeromicropila herbilytica TaxID=2785025 RepID=A0A7R7ELG2_9FIRM|nr:YlmH/Sll1252 family protein [Anaeromicropila herbilytica]BCN31195.1 RNA-binding protein S4 [Anaeromicropila herbilytica]